MTDLQTIIADSFKNDFRRLYFNAYSVTRSLPEGADAARDIVTDAYVQAMKSYTPQAGATLYTWLYRVVTNRSLNHIKAHKNSRRSVYPPAVVESKWQASDVTPRPFTGPERAYFAKERMENTAAKLAAMGPKGEALMLHASGMKHREIAEATGAPLGTVLRRVQVAREKVNA
jgi:RNA polymerase sigma-70 factor (ECF subfamily)